MKRLKPARDALEKSRLMQVLTAWCRCCNGHGVKPDLYSLYCFRAVSKLLTLLTLVQGATIILPTVTL
eukprot:1324638-Amorphochlora_amoeboformis.AAC.2